MYKLLQFISSLLVLCSAHPELQLVIPDTSYSIVSNSKGIQTIVAAVPPSLQSTAAGVEAETSLPLAAPALLAPAVAPTNEISAENSSTEAEDEDDEQPVPASVTRSRPTASQLYSSIVSVPSDSIAAATSSTATVPSSLTSVAATRASLLIATAGRSTPPIQHTILPARTIPLPITITTRPGLRTVIAPETISIHEPIVARIGQVVHDIPTAVSHQRQTVVHNHARVVTPIVAPVVRTINSHVLRAYHTPIVYAPQTQVLRVLQN